MSICSAMSDVSISINGTEMGLEQAIDDTFKSIQKHLNGTQCNIYSLAQAEDRGEGFQYSYELQKKIEYSLSEMLLLFKDLKSIVKQIKLNPDNQSERDWKLSYDIQFAQDMAQLKM